MVIDELLDQLAVELGAKIENLRCNALAFADDLVLVANEKFLEFSYGIVYLEHLVQLSQAT